MVVPSLMGARQEKEVLSYVCKHISPHDGSSECGNSAFAAGLYFCESRRRYQNINQNIKMLESCYRFCIATGSRGLGAVGDVSPDVEGAGCECVFE